MGKELTDVELIERYRNGDDKAIEAILIRYKWLVTSVSRSLFLVGGDNEDVIQEGMLGLLKAVISYNGKATFKSYAYICVKNNILSAIRVNNSKKNLPLNTYISLTALNDEDFSVDAVSHKGNPETEFIDKESIDELKNSIKQVLSEFEYNVLKKYLSGNSFSELSVEFNKNQKSIENALHRIRKKIDKKING